MIYKLNWLELSHSLWGRWLSSHRYIFFSYSFFLTPVFHKTWIENLIVKILLYIPKNCAPTQQFERINGENGEQRKMKKEKQMKKNKHASSLR